MNSRVNYAPGPALKARKDAENDGRTWSLVLVRELRHPRAMVWEALTDPAQLAEWAPFDADRNLATVGPVTLTTVAAPSPHVSESTVKRAEPPRVLEHSWGGNDLRWELEPLGAGTRLTLWINIDRRFVSWGATGWHICFDVLDQLLAGEPIGRIAGPASMKLAGWHQLHAEYKKQLGIEDQS